MNYAQRLSQFFLIMHNDYHNSYNQVDYNDCYNSHSGCPQSFFRHYTSCYKFENLTMNWIDAEKHCQTLHPHSHLVSIEKREEHDFIISYRNYNDGMWITMSLYELHVGIRLLQLQWQYIPVAVKIMVYEFQWWYMN